MHQVYHSCYNHITPTYLWQLQAITAERGAPQLLPLAVLTLIKHIIHDNQRR